MTRFFSKKTVYILLIVLFSLVFVAGGLSIISYFQDTKKTETVYNELSEQIITRPTTPAGEEPAPTETDPSTGQPVVPPLPPEEDPATLVDVKLPSGETVKIMRKYSLLYPQNTDMIGWLSIDGTNVNYPVMSTPEDPEYYLSRNFYKEEIKSGSLFIQAGCDPFTPSDNITIYGHNMRDNTMFGDLDEYTKKEFWEQHKYITFDTLYEEHTYEIIAVFKTTATVGKGFAYHTFINAGDQLAFENYVKKCHNRELYSTGVTAEYGDKLITLSTCEYTQYAYNGRLVVVAKQVS